MSLAAIAMTFLLSVAFAVSWETARPGYHYEFPRDHFNHPGFQTEWWYYTGNVKTPDGRRFGFELTFFRQGVDPDKPDQSTDRGSPWDVRDLYLAHLALSDIDAGKFYNTDRLNRSGPGIAGADLAQRRIWNGNWQAQWRDGGQSLAAVCEGFTFQIDLAPVKGPVIHGKTGVSQKAAGEGKASHYISFTRLRAKGFVEVSGRRFEVTGLAWMDHEYFTHQLASDQAGWDWFSIQLDDGSDLMLYRLRRKDGSTDSFSCGTWVDRSGKSRSLAASEFILEPGETWSSPSTGARYPVRWKIRVPSLELALDLSTPLNNQELVSRRNVGPSYWEGAADYNGSVSGQPVKGFGYLEMTGYDSAINLGETASRQAK